MWLAAFFTTAIASAQASLHAFMHGISNTVHGDMTPSLPFQLALRAPTAKKLDSSAYRSHAGKARQRRSASNARTVAASHCVRYDLSYASPPKQ